ncbi:hypothetical protein WP5S18E09_08140 [Escherichia coli]|nr:hypothetical protein WP5S18E09_08140 [Escherichia coli]
MLRDTGGIKPHERKRAVAHLTLSEREEIRAGLSAKMSIRAIATALNRSPSTISREVQRNRGRRYYKAVDANNRANRMAKRPKPCLLDQNLPLRKLVLEKLEMKWSPEQISGWLRRTKPRQKTLRISPETIYKTLYFRSREALHLKWSTKTGHRVRVFSSIDFPIRLVVTHHYIRAVLVRCNIQRYSPLLRELHR